MRYETALSISLATTIFLAGCDSSEHITHEPGQPTKPVTFPVCQGAERFDRIPPLTFYREDIMDDFVRTEFLQQSKAMGEELLFARVDEATQIIRLTLLPAMTFFTVAVRVETSGDETTLTAKKAPKQDGNDLGVPPFEKHVELTPQQWSQLQARIADADFWNLPTPESRIGRDGAHWIVEAVAGGCYHIVNRWSPNPDSEYGRLTEYVLELADLP